MLVALLTIVGSVSAADSTPGAGHARTSPLLAFQIEEGHEINFLLRHGELAAHLVLRSGTEPRILVAFPAGDSGVALWFNHTQRPVTFTLVGAPRPVLRTDSEGRALRGIEAEIKADASLLAIRRVVLSSVRVIRNVEAGSPLPAELEAEAVRSGSQLVWARNRLDGAPGYRLEVEALEDAEITPQAIRARPADTEASGRSSPAGEEHPAREPRALHLIIRAFSGEPALVPLAPDELLKSSAARDTRERHALEFLSYREKFLAGSWRFDTYFGRDTLMSLALLLPVLQQEAIESGLRSVLLRLAPDGEVAHEEAIGEFAILENIAAGRGVSAAPVYDYSMIDESFMLAPVAADWLLEGTGSGAPAARFLALSIDRSERAGDALVCNLSWVVERAAPFAARARIEDLVGLKPGEVAGDWRDSRNGLGGGRYPYDVNAVWVPVALGATARLLSSGLLDPYLSSRQRQILSQAAAERERWASRAPPLFVVHRSGERARSALARYADTLHIDASAALASLGQGPVAFDALALDASGQPIPVMQSDIGFALRFEKPARGDLERMVSTAARPFPAGLLTPVGLLVADPVFAGPGLQALFTSHAYHGTVIWSWQEALLVAGLDRQLSRTDLDPSLRARLEDLRSRLWAAIEATRTLRAAELWTWSFTDGRYRAVSFEPQNGAVTESDAAQLWSTAFLALRAP